MNDLTAASAFYSDAIGFDRTVWHYPGALFLAAAGYHHHLGTNTWAGAGATPPTEEDAQLLEWTIIVPKGTSLDEVSQSLARVSAPVELASRDGVRSLVTRDPWGTAIRLQAENK